VKVGIIGSNITDYDFFNSKIKSYVKKKDIIVSGDSDGVDILAKRYAMENNIKIKEISLDGQRHAADFVPFLRNEQIIKESDIVVIIYDVRSKFISSLIKVAKFEEKKLYIFIYQKEKLSLLGPKYSKELKDVFKSLKGK